MMERLVMLIINTFCENGKRDIYIKDTAIKEICLIKQDIWFCNFVLDKKVETDIIINRIDIFIITYKISYM